MFAMRFGLASNAFFLLRMHDNDVFFV